eukprot:scpid14432/ scgid0394/ OTU domain-containing protein 7B; Cellular zinc finger anti-NF-kappa-B protein; Zinc finger A20 domain-containing protein 1; Zinc finger protein Cezanne
MACSGAARQQRRPEEHSSVTGSTTSGVVVRKNNGQTRSQQKAAIGAAAFHRGMSTYNPTITQRYDVFVPERSRGDDSDERSGSAVNGCSFMLPNITSLERSFSGTVWHDLVDSLTMEMLQRRDRLNWLSRHAVRACLLIPLQTTGDGNCLLHAASLAMWGHHDRFHALRRAVRLTLEGQPIRKDLLAAIHPGSASPSVSSEYEAKAMAASIHRRWLWQANNHNMESCGGFSLTSDQWAGEWKSVLEFCSSEDNSRQNDGSPVYHPLEEIHIFALSQVLRRPIVVLADKHAYGATSGAISPIYYSGIYLPLLIPADQCYRAPVLLTYLHSHFCGLVAMDTKRLSSVWTAPKQLSRTTTDKLYSVDINDVHNIVPLEMPDGGMLELQFSMDPGEGFCPSKQYGTDKMPRGIWNSYRKSEQSSTKQELLCKYMNLVKITTPNAGGRRCAVNTDTPDGQPVRYFPSSDSSGNRLILAAQLGPSDKPPGYSQFVRDYLSARVSELSTAKYDAVSDLATRMLSTALEEYKNYAKAPHPRVTVQAMAPVHSPKLSSSEQSTGSAQQAGTGTGVAGAAGSTTKVAPPRPAAWALSKSPQSDHTATTNGSNGKVQQGANQRVALPNGHSSTTALNAASPSAELRVNMPPAINGSNNNDRVVAAPRAKGTATTTTAAGFPSKQTPSWLEFEQTNAPPRLPPAPPTSTTASTMASTSTGPRQRNTGNGDAESNGRSVFGNNDLALDLDTKVNVGHKRLQDDRHQQRHAPDVHTTARNITGRLATNGLSHDTNSSISTRPDDAIPAHSGYVPMAAIQGHSTSRGMSTTDIEQQAAVRRPHRPRAGSLPTTTAAGPMKVVTASHSVAMGTTTTTSRAGKLEVSSTSRHPPPANQHNRPHLGAVPLTADFTRNMILQNRVRHGTDQVDSGSAPHLPNSSLQNPSDRAENAVYQNVPATTRRRPPVPKRDTNILLPLETSPELPKDGPRGLGHYHTTARAAAAQAPAVGAKPVLGAQSRGNATSSQYCTSCGNPRSVRTMTCSECFQHWQRQAH